MTEHTKEKQNSAKVDTITLPFDIDCAFDEKQGITVRKVHIAQIILSRIGRAGKTTRHQNLTYDFDYGRDTDETILG